MEIHHAIDFPITAIPVLCEVCRADNETDQSGPAKKRDFGVENAAIRPNRMEIPPKTSCSLTVMLVNKDRCASNLRELLLSLNQIDRAVFCGGRFHLQETTKTLFLKKSGRKCERRGDASDWITGITWRLPGIEKPALACGDRILIPHSYTSLKSSAKDHKELNR
jgi:hypothetical protein